MHENTVFNIMVCDDSVTHVFVLSKIVQDNCRANTIEGRITDLADIFDALTTKRPYKRLGL
jgi:hypothetical protein